MKKRQIMAWTLTTAMLCSQTVVSADTQLAPVKVTIDLTSEKKEISPYIYGVNDGINLKYTKVGAVRQGGNRTSAYNWENNLSNAGSDYVFSTDNFVIDYNVRPEYKKVPAGPALDFLEDAKEFDVPYTLLTLQMLGYVADGEQKKLADEDTAPNETYWAEVVNEKGDAFSMSPDLTDHKVYMDEYMNYLINTVGDSQHGGIKAYSLDNEPSLWHSTHKLAQTEPLTCETLIQKTKALAKTVKKMDAGAEVFGPALYGYMAFVSLQGAPDWKTLQAQGGYEWFVDYYLDMMKQAEEEEGQRLVDVLDMHFYSEAKGACGERLCMDDTDECIKNRIDSVRSMWDSDYHEDSWIKDTGAQFLPLLPAVQKSIDKYYPGTKIAFSEYDFGMGDHISGGIAEVDFLGTLAKYGVYFATLWSFDHNFFQLGAINMFTDYDNEGTGFGDQLITGTTSSDDYLVSAYAATTSTEEDGTVRVILTNKDPKNETPVELTLAGAEGYGSVEKYVMQGDIAGSKKDKAFTGKVVGDTLSLTLSPLSVTELVIRKDAAAETETEAPTTQESKETQPETTSPDEKPDNNISPVVWGAIAVACLAVIGVTSSVTNRKKKK